MNMAESKICGLCKKVHANSSTKCASSEKKHDDKKKK